MAPNLPKSSKIQIYIIFFRNLLLKLKILVYCKNRNFIEFRLNFGYLRKFFGNSGLVILANFLEFLPTFVEK